MQIQEILVDTCVTVTIASVKPVRIVQIWELLVDTCVTATNASVRNVRIVQTTRKVLVNTFIDIGSPNHAGYV